MKLGQKNLVYSMVLAGIMLAFLAGYFSYMLPSLYVDYCMEQNLKSIREQHAAYMDTGTYDGIQVKNGTACYSVEIPLEGNYLRVTGKAFSVEVELREERLVHILQRLREILQADWAGGVQLERDSLEKTKKTDTLGQMQEELAEVFRELYGETEGGPFQIRLLYSRSMEEAYFNETMRYHTYSDNMVILEAGVEDGENKYTNYMAVQMTKDRIVLSFLPVVTPDMEEIKPIVWQSLPMLGAVVVLVVLLFSRVYSRGIVAPIVELSNHAEQMKYARDFSVERLESKRKEKQGEIRELADTLDDFYDRIREGYGQLQAKNAQLQAENEREEVFLRTSAHQLKTPIAAALLLADGMIHGVGKYQDVKTYLPKVKEQLLSMRKMTEDILYLNRCVKEREMQMLSPGKLLQEKLRLLEPVLAQKHLRLEYGQGEEDAGEEGTGRRDGKKGREEGEICTDERMFTQIVDSLLSNAVAYTPEGERISIWVSGDGSRIRIENYGTRIPETLLPRIFEPFVEGGQEQGSGGTRGHGLGLYIASYFAKKLGITLSVANGTEKAEGDRNNADGTRESRRSGAGAMEDRAGAAGEDSVVALLIFGETVAEDLGGDGNLHESFMGTSSEIHMDAL